MQTEEGGQIGQTAREIERGENRSNSDRRTIRPERE